MSDEDPKSLLFLCDDTLREMLSYMPLRSRVRHSGTCTAMYQVVEQSMLSVKSLDDEWNMAIAMKRRLNTQNVVDQSLLTVNLLTDNKPNGMPLTESVDFKSRMKTLSKLKNLISMKVPLGSDCEAKDEIISVMVNNCHYIRHFKSWDEECILQYVTGLMGKKVPVRLKEISLFFSRKELATNVIQKTDLKLTDVSVAHFSLFQVTGSWNRVIGVKSIPEFNLPLESMKRVKKLCGLHAGDEHRVKQILQSMPQLNDFAVVIQEDVNNLLQIMAEAGQQFRRLDMQILYSAPEGNQVDYLKRMLESQGRHLRQLRIMIRMATPETATHVLNLVSSHCSRLRELDLLAERREGRGGKSITYRNHMLTTDWTDASHTSLLRIFPNVRVVRIYGFWAGGQVAHQLMSELRYFALGMKKKCIIVEMVDKTRCLGHIFSAFDQNLLVYRRVD